MIRSNTHGIWAGKSSPPVEEEAFWEIHVVGTKRFPDLFTPQSASQRDVQKHPIRTQLFQLDGVMTASRLMGRVPQSAVTLELLFTLSL
jgi:hypothetical protein